MNIVPNALYGLWKRMELKSKGHRKSVLRDGSFQKYKTADVILLESVSLAGAIFKN